ncbi:unnamed protein product [Ostreobium quekettii]|uniref:CYTH domain-containing protein n=1 Tax=Ostreobium quekettii TaxID=121088 RepID=A0A8S1IQS5_9CHLO|nr:unnamed protein product [Ostreobium quekettii]
MGRNVEIKARLPADRVRAVRELALERSTSPPESLRQTDTFYNVPTAWCPVPDPRSLSEALGRSLGVRGVVEKQREVIMVGRTRVHLDEVAGLGTFLELEVQLAEGQSAEEGEAVAAELMAHFGVGRGCLVEGAYIDAIEAKSGE